MVRIACGMMDVRHEDFGDGPGGARVEMWTLRHGDWEAEFLNQGAILRSWRWPDASGPVDVVLGCLEAADYVADKCCHGAVVGRYGNRIAKGRFELHGRMWQLTVNNGEHHLHGGSPGFDKAVWRVAREEDALVFRHHSPDGDQGYPGNLEIAVRVRLGEDGALRYDFEARADAPTILNPTAHPYFNLGGWQTGRYEEDHDLRIFASRYVPKRADGIPLGGFAPVADTMYDFREWRGMAEPEDAELSALRGYDHSWMVDGEDLRLAALARHRPSGRSLAVETTAPAIHFYNGEYNDTSPARMKDGMPGMKRSGFALEAQLPPDSPNQPGFPGPVLRPGEVFRSTTIYRPAKL